MVYRRKGVRRAPAGKRKLATRRPGVKKMYRRKAPARRQAVSRLVSTAGGLTLSKFQLTSRGSATSKFIKKVTNPQIYQINDGQLIQALAGGQGYKSFMSLTRANLQQMLATITVAGATNIPPGYPPVSRMVLESLQSELSLSNTGNSAQEIVIYDVVLKRDVLVQNLIRTGSLAANNLWTVNGLNGADDFILQGMRASTGQDNTDSTDHSRYIGSLPYDSVFFRDYFRVLKRTEVMIASGGTHRHNVNLKPNRLIDQSLGANENVFGIKGLTYLTLVYVRGTPGYDLNAAVGSVPPQWTNVVHTQRAKFSWVTDGGSGIYGYSTLDTEGAVKVRNVGSGLYTDGGPGNDVIIPT